MNPDEIRFAADAMLQSLAKWLRLLGYDCVASNALFGRNLLELAIAEHRWVLTRNFHFTGDLPLVLLSHSEIQFIRSKRLPDQVSEVVKRFSLESSAFVFTRCLVCNQPLQKAPPQIISEVPPRVAQREKVFWQCTHCGRIFWKGSHVTNSLQRLNKWLSDAKE